MTIGVEEVWGPKPGCKVQGRQASLPGAGSHVIVPRTGVRAPRGNWLGTGTLAILSFGWGVLTLAQREPKRGAALRGAGPARSRAGDILWSGSQRAACLDDAVMSVSLVSR